ncbi:hypothetical protein QFC20_006907 [Naganishia adeliensis]|uniref:Uncharacterized protein n=1 Tax=Naganishia adeliensis TaxID=92952 RepID=A0ACC2V575_9TREE|nr:hypothetical protein QFC20_006907 [Naganishia adeliensis]
MPSDTSSTCGVPANDSLGGVPVNQSVNVTEIDYTRIIASGFDAMDTASFYFGDEDRTSHPPHDPGCTFSVRKTIGEQEENSDDDGFYRRPAELFRPGEGDKVPVIHCVKDAGTSPYVVEVQAIKALKHGDNRFNPCIFIGQVDPKSAKEDLRCLWQRIGTEGAGLECSSEFQKYTPLGLQDDLERTVDEDDKEALESLIEAIKSCDFSSESSDPPKLVRRGGA